MNPYTILGVDSTASIDEIKAAYRRAARQHHPDMGGDAAKFVEVKAAYESLMRTARPSAPKRTGAKVCSVCENKGFTRVRQGAFTKKVPCPVCWKDKEHLFR